MLLTPPPVRCPHHVLTAANHIHLRSTTENCAVVEHHGRQTPLHFLRDLFDSPAQENPPPPKRTFASLINTLDPILQPHCHYPQWECCPSNILITGWMHDIPPLVNLVEVSICFKNSISALSEHDSHELDHGIGGEAENKVIGSGLWAQIIPNGQGW